MNKNFKAFTLLTWIVLIQFTQLRDVVGELEKKISSLRLRTYSLKTERSSEDDLNDTTRPKHVLEGVSSGIKYLLGGLLFGASRVITKPISETREKVVTSLPLGKSRSC